MSGLFRRLRRRKAADEEEEPSAPAVEEAPSDPDIYPHRSPDDEGDPDIATEPAPAESDPTVTGEDAESDSGPSGPPVDDGPTAPVPPPEPGEAAEEVRSPVPEVRPEVSPSPLGVPPPLPSADEGAGRSSHRPLAAPNHCFLCGTEMTGSFCPTCRMTWNE